MPQRTILVVGANKGIGFAVVEVLAKRSPEDHILLGVRDMDRGKAAIDRLRENGVKSSLDLVEIDITSDESIRAAEGDVRSRFGKLDVLINNAAIARLETLETLRDVYRTVFDMNVASVILTCEIFLPLLRESQDPRIIQVSTARASITRGQYARMPPVWAVSYGASKAALNMATLELLRRPENSKVVFQTTSPGHTRTDFNNNRGHKEPLDSARVIVELALEERKGRLYAMWEIEGEQTEPCQVPW